MTLDPKYVVTSDVDTFFVNKDTGLPLANGQLIFYRDSARNVPKAVYELSGTPPTYTYTSMGAVVTLSTTGTVEDSQGSNQVIYYRPYILDPVSGLDVLDLYYVVGQDENGVVQFTREAWPNITPSSSTTPVPASAPQNNQISNSTFTNVFLNRGVPTTISVSGAVSQVVPIGPDWALEITGTGSILVSQIPISGNANIVTSPPYVLDINIGGGIGTCYLRQRFNYNSGLWTSNSGFPVFLNGSFIAQNQSGGTVVIGMFYREPTSGFIPIQIVNATVSTLYTLFQGGTVSQIPLSGDTGLGQNGYVDIYFSLAGHIKISSVELIPSYTTFVSANGIPYSLDSSNRNEAYQGDYYISQLVQKPINSYLVGWDFPQNPFQFAPILNISGLPQYIADQTILGTGPIGLMNYGQDLISKGLLFNTGNTQSFYLLQYLSGSAVKEIIFNPLSVNVFGYATSGTITMRVYLYRCPSTSIVPFLTVGSIGNVTNSGIFSVSAVGWTEIPRSGLDTATATLNSVVTNTDILNGNNDYAFTGWELIDATQIGDSQHFAIVTTFAYTGSNNLFTINSISCVPGNIPCRPAYESADEVLRKCQFYYLKSFSPSIPAAQNTGLNSGVSYSLQSAGPSALQGGPIVRFSNPMRSAITGPTVTLYNPVAFTADIYDVTNSTSWSGSTAGGVTVTGFYTEGTAPAGSTNGNLTAVNWSADVRLGVV